MNIHLYTKTQVRVYMCAVDLLEMHVCDPVGDVFLGLCDVFREIKLLRSHDEAVRSVLTVAGSCDGELNRRWEEARLQLRNDFIINSSNSSRKGTAVSRKAIDAYWRCEDMFSAVCFQPWCDLDETFREAVVDLGAANAREKQADAFLKSFFPLRDQMCDDHVNNPYFDHGDKLKRLLVPSWRRA